MSKEDLKTYTLEVQRFHTDSTLHVALLDTRLDTWWALVFQTGKFPALSKMVAALLSCVHGPQVEGSFSVMGNVITTKPACLGIKTFDAIQSVKYSLKASETSTVQFFKKSDHLHNSVDSRLVCDMTCVYKRYHEDAKKKCKAKRAKLELAKEKAQPKKDCKELNVKAAQKARKAHR